MVMALRDGSRGWLSWRGARWGLGAVSLLAALGVACSDDDSDGGGGQCIGGEGAVSGEASTHCIVGGMVQAAAIGECTSAAADDDAGDADDDDDHPVLFGREADDDECKYHVRFENTCVVKDEPVTFTLSLTRLIDGRPGTGTVPSNPEVFLDADHTHITQSNNITATESPAGTYKIGPIVFDQSGRWVIRFHYFENCSEVAEDSPHSHAAFYIDVP